MMTNESITSGRYIMRAIDEFWGESWPHGNVASVEVYEVVVNKDMNVKPTMILDEYHVFDMEGGLVESIFYDNSKPYLIRRNEYDLSDCITKRIAINIESEDTTTWAYRMDSTKNQIITTIHSSKRQVEEQSDIYSIDEMARIVSCDFGVTSKNDGDRWLVKRDLEGRIFQHIAEGVLTTNTIIWEYCYNSQKDPTHIRQYTTDGRLQSERCYSYNYDSAGNWILEVEMLNDLTVEPLFTERRERIRKIEYRN